MEAGAVRVRRSAGIVRIAGERAEKIEGDTKSSKPRAVDVDAETIAVWRAPMVTMTVYAHVVSEGGLELSLSGTHRASPGDSQTRSDLRASVAPSHPALIREHPESSAPVSREVSPAMLTTLLPSGPAAAFVAP